MTKPSDALINKLRERQQADKLSDEDFAALLGIGRATWILIRTRESSPGLKFLAGTSRLDDEFDDDILTFLKREPGLMDLWTKPVLAQPIPA